MVKIDLISNKNQSLVVFQSKKEKELSINPELDYFMSEEKSDVDGQHLPAIKMVLVL